MVVVELVLVVDELVVVLDVVVVGAGPVDTMIVTGCNTSGCIRASAVDSFSYRYRTIVPEDCVGDIEEQPHRDNLRDIGRRYVDVSDLATVLAQLEDWRRQNAA